MTLVLVLMLGAYCALLVRYRDIERAAQERHARPEKHHQQDKPMDGPANPVAHRVDPARESSQDLHVEAPFTELGPRNERLPTGYH